MQKGKGAFWEQQSSPLELAQVWELRGIRERRSLYWVPESHAEQLGLHPGSLWGQKSAALGDQGGHSVKSRNGTRKECVLLEAVAMAAVRGGHGQTQAGGTSGRERQALPFERALDQNTQSTEKSCMWKEETLPPPKAL